MKVLVIGKGGREHAIAWKLSKSPRISQLLCAPGNAGTDSAARRIPISNVEYVIGRSFVQQDNFRFAVVEPEIPRAVPVARNVPVSETDVDGLLAFASKARIDFTVVGPEAPLAAGIVDKFQEEGLSIFGPSQSAAQIESSKSFAKDLMARASVPTAQAEVFHHFEAARAYVKWVTPPVVIKADGLAAGKGVVVANTTEQALLALQAQMVDRVFGTAGETVLIEEHLQGPELSVFAFVDGKRLSPLVAAVDYKRVGDGDSGPNTGGMGAYSPPLNDLWNDDIERSARTDIMEPVVAALATEGCPYVGILYAGLMLTRDGLKVIEFNCRLGDPEAQVILPRIETDLLDLMLATVEGNVDSAPLRVSPEPCVGVVVASGGYPDAYETGFSVAGLNETHDDVTIFHAGTKFDENEETVTDGGRVLTVSGSGATHKEARHRAYSAAEKTTFEGSFFRGDIADFARQ